jgi:hypothetical protein
VRPPFVSTFVGRPTRSPVRFQSGNPRDFAVKAGKHRRPPIDRKPLFCRTFLGRSGFHVLLAMQKVEGSNPFSRSSDSLAFAGLSRAYCLFIRGFLAPPGGPTGVRSCFRTCVDPAPGRHWQRPGGGDLGRAKRRGEAPVERGCGAPVAPRKEPVGLVGRATQYQLELLGRLLCRADHCERDVPEPLGVVAVERVMGDAAEAGLTAPVDERRFVAVLEVAPADPRQMRRGG